MPKIPINLQFKGGNHELGYYSGGACIVGGYVDNKGVVVPQPGFEAILDSNADPVATDTYIGAYFAPEDPLGKTYIVTELGRVDYITNLGTYAMLTTGSGDVLGYSSNLIPFTCADFGDTLYFAAGKKILEVPSSMVASEIADADAPTDVGFINFFDQYLIAHKLDSALSQSNQLYWSDVGAPGTWNNNYGSAEYKPDDIMAFDVRNKEMLVLCKNSSEVWYNDGETPFSPINGAQNENGCASPYTLKWCGDRYLWLNQHGKLVQSRGRAVESFSDSLNIYLSKQYHWGYTYNYHFNKAEFINVGGKRFYVLYCNLYDFNGATNIVCDLENNTWTEWGSWTTGNNPNVYTHLRFRNVTFDSFNNVSIACKDTSAGVFYLKCGVNSDAADNDIRLTVRTPTIDYGTISTRKFPRQLIIEMVYKDTTHGLPSSSTTYDVYVKWRESGVSTWGTEHTVTCHPVGGGVYRGVLNRLGSYYARQYELYNTDCLGFASVEEVF